MKLVRPFGLMILAATLALPGGTRAETFSVAPGTWEGQVGVTGVTLAEYLDAMWAIQVEGRVGRFLREGIELQAVGSARVWPLGDQSPKAFGTTANLLYFPRITESHNLYFLVGAGGLYRSSPNETLGDTGFDGLARVGFGTKVHPSDTGWISHFHLTSEFRIEMLFEQEVNTVAGITFGLSYFR
ncbi:MAG: hypothetical protein R3B81_16820 [bacterium]